MSDHAWMELCEVSTMLLESIEAKLLDVIILSRSCSLSSKAPHQHYCPELTTTTTTTTTKLVLETVPSSSSLLLTQQELNTVYLHPLLYEFLIQSASLCDFHDNSTNSSASVSIAPLPFAFDYDCGQRTSTTQHHDGWTISRVTETRTLPSAAAAAAAACKVCLTCMYYESAIEDVSLLKRQIRLAMEGRLIVANGLLAVPTLSAGACLVVVTSIISDDGSDDVTPSVAYKVRSDDCELIISIVDDYTIPDVSSSATAWEKECPGYDNLLQQLITLSQLTGVAAPSGVLLTGCAGVGKSHLASCLAYHAAKSDDVHVHWVSVQDLAVRASWATERDLLDFLLPPKTTDNKRCLLVLDDLHILEIDRDDIDHLQDAELLLAHNSILVALDRIPSSVFILGITHAALRLPHEFVRIGRLEKELYMPPPTQVQREAILEHLLVNYIDDDAKRQRFAETLAVQTSGCVASDLRRLCANALSRAQSMDTQEKKMTWNHLRDAAQICIPSQLAQLDVTKTVPCPEDEDGRKPNMLRVHEWSWRKFGGYHQVKKRLFRTVVMPWRRHMELVAKGVSANDDDVLEGWVTPPSGVLFHGRPGTGKTFAASCLASSLCLDVVKVRASDVLDQWLGGSEAAIRSLFARARSASPCILFFDEIDAIASNRQDEGFSLDVTSRVLTTFLNEMDGISSGAKGGVLVVACTNRIEALDAALLRRGRLDEHVLLEMPSESEVKEMLTLHLSKVPLDDDVDLDEVSELLAELNACGADVKGVCSGACSRAIRNIHRLSLTDLTLSQKDLIAAIHDWRK